MEQLRHAGEVGVGVGRDDRGYRRGISIGGAEDDRAGAGRAELRAIPGIGKEGNAGRIRLFEGGYAGQRLAHLSRSLAAEAGDQLG